MVATSPAATSADAPAGSQVQHGSPTTTPHIGEPAVSTPPVGAPVTSSVMAPNLPVDESPGSGRTAVDPFPAFVALIQSGPRRATAAPAGGTHSPSTAVEPPARATRRRIGRERLHPAWLDAIPASIDELQGAPAPAESELETAVREAVILGTRHKSPRIALPRGRWPWWAWVTYASTVGTATFAGLYVVALARMALPEGRGLWVYRTRRGAARFVAMSTALLVAGAGAMAIVPPQGHLTAQVVDSASHAPAALDVGAHTVPAAPVDAVEPLTDAVTPVAISLVDAAAVSITVAESVAEPGSSGDPLTIPAEAVPQVDAPPPAPAPPTIASGPSTRVVVTNTGGRGVAFRNSPSWDDRVVPKVAVRDGTLLTVLESGVIGDDGAGGTTAFARVRDAAGRVGYVPTRFVQAR